MADACDNFPDWQGCECGGYVGGPEDGHDGPHGCVCGARWDDDGYPVGMDGERTGLALPQSSDCAAVRAAR